MYNFQFLAEDAQANTEKLQSQLSQLNNKYSYSLDQINNLSHENNQLTQKIEFFNDQISYFSKLSHDADLLHQTLSEENHTFSREKLSFSKKEAMFSHQYSILHEINENQARTLRVLKEQYETSLKYLSSQNEKLVQNNISLSVKKNQFQEQYSQLKNSHDVIKKKNKSLSSEEKKIRSRLSGSVGDGFDKSMESMKDNTLALSKFFQDSERSHQSVVTQLKSELSKVRKECANLEISRDYLKLSLSASRSRARIRFAYQKNFLEINARNLERVAIRKGHSSAQSVIDGILVSNSLPAVKLPVCNVSADEEYPEPDSDYDFLSDDKKDEDEEENQQDEEKPANEANAEIENQQEEEKSADEVIIEIENPGPSTKI
ncbi:altered inheritance of mitochondria protein 44-like [Papaver somniferum]|uniref:altered inheritance of mitochondria protein 44-like n=1 Tax=Papaver somniferum TaxID=3469 RepID=UPI000E6FEE0D|nr:altered inheritance of mitochondria protein 44-like [Papaver somniferum]